jgi:hypothetical protein
MVRRGPPPLDSLGHGAERLRGRDR